MTNPLLSICIPTFNRGQMLKTTLESIVSDPIFQETDKVEIVISDNCSTDDTPNVCRYFVERYPDKVHYSRLEKPITGDENFIVVMNLGKGTYLKLNNDKLIFRKNALTSIVEVLESREVGNVLFLFNNLSYHRRTLPPFEITECRGFNEFMSYITYLSTWIGGLCVKAEPYFEIENPVKYSYLHFGHIYIMSELLKKDEKGTIFSKDLFFTNTEFILKRDYSITRVFGKEFDELLHILMNENLLKNRVYKKIIYKNLPIINYFFRTEIQWKLADFKEYFSNLLPIYGLHLYFYKELFLMFIKKIVEKTLCVKEDDKIKLKICGITLCSHPNVRTPFNKD